LDTKILHRSCESAGDVQGCQLGALGRPCLNAESCAVTRAWGGPLEAFSLPMREQQCPNRFSMVVGCGADQGYPGIHVGRAIGRVFCGVKRLQFSRPNGLSWIARKVCEEFCGQHIQERRGAMPKSVQWSTALPKGLEGNFGTCRWKRVGAILETLTAPR